MEQIASEIAGDARFQLISKGRDEYYRIWHPSGSTVLKVYGSQSRWRRENRALSTLSGVDGLPTIVQEWMHESTGESTAWVEFVDAGRWTLASMPENRDVARQAGQILQAVHTADPGELSNLSGGMDQAWIESDYASTFERLGRYRRRLNIPAALLERAKNAARPSASEPRATHAKPHPRKFVVSDDGDVTLIDWAWSTLAPPEWDYSEAVWLTTLVVGVDAGEAMASGYGRAMSDDAMQSWIVYHAGMLLLSQAETRDGPLEDLSYIVEQLHAIV